MGTGQPTIPHSVCREVWEGFKLNVYLSSTPSSFQTLLLVQKLKALLLFRGGQEPSSAETTSILNVVTYLCELTADLPGIQSQASWDGQVKYIQHIIVASRGLYIIVTTKLIGNLKRKFKKRKVFFYYYPISCNSKE